MRKVVLDRRQQRQCIRFGVVDLHFEEVLPIVERPRIAHLIVRGDANLALGAEDPPLYGWDLGLLASISRFGVGVEGCGAVQLVGEDDAG